MGLMNFKQYLKENDKLKSLKSFFDKLQFKVVNQQTLKNWEKNINNEYGFDNYVHTDPTDDFYTSINNLKSKFGEPRIERDVNPRNGDTIIYNWGIEFGDGNKAILQGLTNEDAMEMFGELDPDEDHPWDVYVANDQDEQNASDVVERIKTILNKQTVQENNKLSSFKQFVNSQQFEISKDPNFSDVGFECLGSFVAALKDVRNKFGEPQKLNLPLGNLDPWVWKTGSQSQPLYEYALWAFTFKDGLKCIITPGFHSNMMDYLKNTHLRQNYFNYNLETASERWYVHVPTKKSKEKTISKQDLKNRISSIFPNSEVSIQEESNKLEGLKSFQKGNKIIEIVNPDRLVPSEVYKRFAFQANTSLYQLEKRLGTVFHYPHPRMYHRYKIGWGLVFGDGTLVAIFRDEIKGLEIDKRPGSPFDVWSNKGKEEVVERFRINNIPLNII